jgi:hypothetical protein
VLPLSAVSGVITEAAPKDPTIVRLQAANVTVVSAA